MSFYSHIDVFTTIVFIALSQETERR